MTLVTNVALPRSGSVRNVVAALSVGGFAGALDMTVTNIALPRIQESLGADVAAAAWIVNGFLAALGATVLFAGNLADRFGARRTLLVGLALFGAASLGCGLASHVSILVGARVLQGVGWALFIPSAQSLFRQEIADPSARARAISLYTMQAMFAAVVGPTLGGLLADTVGWRVIFLANVPACLISMMLVLRHVAASPAQDSHPFLFPIRELARHGILRACSTQATASFGNLGFLFAASMLFQQVRGDDALRAGMRLLPLSLALIAGAAVAARLAASWTPDRLLLAGLAASGSATLAFALVPPSSEYAMLVPLLALFGAGQALIVPSISAHVLERAPAGAAGAASALAVAARMAGGAIGVWILASLPAAGSFDGSSIAAAFAVLAGAFALSGAQALFLRTRREA